MNYIKLNNDLEMPLVGLGTWNLNGQECKDTVSSALKLGYRLIDTAQMYGNEKEVGMAIKESGIDRSQIFLTTKIYRISNSYEKAKQAIELSLNNLQVDYIDLLLLHEPYHQGPQMYQALQEAYQQGKVKAIGISNYDEKWYQEFLTTCKIIPMVNQLECHVYFQKHQFQQLMLSKGTIMQAWAPLGQGIDNITSHPILVEIGKKYQKTAAQIALKFLVQRGISVIPKSKHLERLKENIDIFDFVLSDEDINQIKSLDRNDTFFPWTKGF